MNRCLVVQPEYLRHETRHQFTPSSKRSGIRLEYTGKLGARTLHWLALAVAARGRIYLVTATCPEEDWPKHEKALRAGLESFLLTK